MLSDYDTRWLVTRLRELGTAPSLLIAEHLDASIGKTADVLGPARADGREAIIQAIDDVELPPAVLELRDRWMDSPSLDA